MIKSIGVKFFNARSEEAFDIYDTEKEAIDELKEYYENLKIKSAEMVTLICDCCGYEADITGNGATCFEKDDLDGVLDTENFKEVDKYHICENCFEVDGIEKIIIQARIEAKAQGKTEAIARIRELCKIECNPEGSLTASGFEAINTILDKVEKGE